MSAASVKGSRVSCVVLEIGRSLTRVGFAGDAQPVRIVQTPPFRADAADTVDAALSTHQYPALSSDAWHTWLAPFLRHVYFELLGVQPRDRRVCVVETPLMSTTFKDAMLRALFHLGVPSLTFAPSHALPTMAANVAHALAVDVGLTDTTVCATFDHVTLDASVRFAPMGVANFVQAFARGCTESAGSWPLRLMEDVALPLMHARAVTEANDERVGPLDVHVTAARWNAVQSLDTFSRSTFKPHAPLSVRAAPPPLPVVLRVSASARASSCEALFDIEADDGDTLVSACVECVRSLPLDVRRAVVSSVILTGGGSEVPGMARRTQEALRTQLANDRELATLAQYVTVVTPTVAVSPSLLPWFGASLFCVVRLDWDDQWLDREQLTAALQLQQHQAQEMQQQPERTSNFARDQRELLHFLPEPFRLTVLATTSD